MSGRLLVVHGAIAGDAAAGARLAGARCVACHSSSENLGNQDIEALAAHVEALR
jgi:mono/diheme cytochrome c family protein